VQAQHREIERIVRRSCENFASTCKPSPKRIAAWLLAVMNVRQVAASGSTSQ
jgi:hypothetical protein